MAQDPNKIAEMRSQKRMDKPNDLRQARALEDIADTLEAIRIDLAGFQAEFFRQKR